MGFKKDFFAEAKKGWNEASTESRVISVAVVFALLIAAFLLVWLALAIVTSYWYVFVIGIAAFYFRDEIVKFVKGLKS